MSYYDEPFPGHNPAMHGDYASLAEAVGEAPPREVVFTADFFDDPDFQHDPEMAEIVMDRMTAENKRAREEWFKSHPSQSYEQGYDEGYRRALLDNGIEPDDGGPPPGCDD